MAKGSAFVLLLGMPNVSKTICDGPIKMVLSQKAKKVGGCIQFLFFWSNHFDWPINIFFALGTTQNRSTKVLPFGLFIYIWKFNYGQNTWDKGAMLLEAFWGTHWELDGNLLEFNGNKMGIIKSPSTQSSKKKPRFLECMSSLFTSHMKIMAYNYFSHFWLVLISLFNKLGHLWCSYLMSLA